MLKYILIFSFLILFQNCATNTIGSKLTAENQVKNLLKSGITNADTIFGNPNDFLTNALIEVVIPNELREINKKLTQMGLNSVVEKQNKIIGDVAKNSIIIMKPILNNAIENITPVDAINILSGKKGEATKYLKEKTKLKLDQAIKSTISSEINKLGINFSQNNIVLNNILGEVLGNKNVNFTSKLETYISSQIVNGLYNVVLDTEIKNNLIINGINSILNSPNK